MNRKLLLLVCFLANNILAGSGDASLADQVASESMAINAQDLQNLNFGDMAEMLKNMTPEQKKDFDEYVDTFQNIYGPKLSAGQDDGKIHSAPKGKDAVKNEDGFFVQPSEGLPTFSELVGDIPDGILFTVKSLNKMRSGKDVGKRRKTMSNRLLLYGPPGTGKTTLAKAFAREIGALYMGIKGTQFVDGYIATGTDRIHKLFEKARNLNEPVVVFIDEIDAIGRERTKERNDEYANTLIALIQELDHCANEAADRVFIIMATNKFGTLDEALRSRCSNSAIEIKAPDNVTGRKIMEYYLNDYDHDPISRPVLWWIGFWTRGFSGRDYENMVNKAYILSGEGTITKQHLYKAMKEARDSRSSAEHEKNPWYDKVVKGFSHTYTIATAPVAVITLGTTIYTLLQGYNDRSEVRQLRDKVEWLEAKVLGMTLQPKSTV